MGRIRFLLCRLGLVALIALVLACSSAPKRGEFTSQQLLEAACPANFTNEAGLKVVRGSVWTKMKSREMNGQFPASVLVEYPRKLAVEVTNLIGAPQAWLKIENGKTELRFTTKNEKEYGKPNARRMLAGLPLELAPRLFAGGVPCPSADKNQDLRVRQTEDGSLEVITLDLRTRKRTRYVYRFIRYAGEPWVSEVEWSVVPKTSQESSNLIRISREEPDTDGAPKRWDASSEHGEIAVRWKDRTIGSQ